MHRGHNPGSSAADMASARLDNKNDATHKRKCAARWTKIATALNMMAAVAFLLGVVQFSQLIFRGRKNDDGEETAKRDVYKKAG